jgi:hypothetical protein
MANPPTMTVEEWQKQLTDTFIVNGLIGGNLLRVFGAEDNAGSYLVKTFRGQNILFDSFQSFFIDTLTIANQQIVANGWPKDRQNYPVCLVYFSNLFRRVRACEILYGKGYPLDAYALMRDIKDRAFMLAGVAHNMVTFSGMIGATGTPVTDPNEYKKQTTRNRKDAEQRITNGLMGKTSGLSADVQEDLKRWDDAFHYEMHGGSVSLSQELMEISKGKIPQIGPSVIKDAYVMYINRSSELGWMIMRLLPFLQASEDAFGKDWRDKRQVLDDSFRYMLEGFSNLGKRLGVSFITMVDTKLAFKKPFFYFEADGSAS